MEAPSKTILKKADIVLAYFPYSNLSTQKLRPCVVLAIQGNEVALVMLSGSVHKTFSNDMVLSPNASNGLHSMSKLCAHRVASVNLSQIPKRIGHLTAQEIALVNVALMKELTIPAS